MHINSPSLTTLFHNLILSRSLTMALINPSRCDSSYDNRHVTTKDPLMAYRTQLVLAQSQKSKKNSSIDGLFTEVTVHLRLKIQASETVDMAYLRSQTVTPESLTQDKTSLWIKETGERGSKNRYSLLSNSSETWVVCSSGSTDCTRWSKKKRILNQAL